MKLKDQVKEFVRFEKEKSLASNKWLCAISATPKELEEIVTKAAHSEHSRLVPLLEILPDVEETLEFYADLHSYYANGKPDLKNHIADDDLEEILYHYSNIELLEYIGGKRARQALTAPSPLDALLQGEK